MTYEEKKAWLWRYREAERLYRRLSYQLAEAQAATSHITQTLSAAPGGSKDGQSLARAVEREQAAENRAYAQLAVCDALYDEIERALVDIPVSNGYLILHKYYLNGQTWAQVAADLHVSVRWVYKRCRISIDLLRL